MATQAISAAGPVYASGGYDAARPSRLLDSLGFALASGTLLRREAARTTVVASYLAVGFDRVASARPLSPGYTPALPPPPPPAVDLTPPFVGNFDPLAGTPIAKTTPISFDVTDESGAFGRIFVVAFFGESGVSELIHDGDGFRTFYARASSRRLIAGGYRYTVLRSGGWPSAPTIQTFAVDHAGNEAS